jgi:hypothetical protein
MIEAIMKKTGLFLLLIHSLTACNWNTTENNTTPCFDFMKDWSELYVHSFSSPQHAQEIHRVIRTFLIEAHQVFQTNKLPDNYEKTWLVFLETQILSNPKASIHLDTNVLSDCLNQLKNHSNSTPICDRLYLFHKISKILSRGTLSSQTDLIELEILQQDTLHLDPNQIYQFPYYLKYHYAKSNVFTLNKIHTLNGDTLAIDYENITIKTPALSDTIIIDTFCFQLQNELTGEFYKESFIIPIYLNK